MDFIALDFETSNEESISACELGIAVVRNYKIVESKSWLICPPHPRFNAYNTLLHGICEDDVKGGPTFRDLWIELESYFENELLVAHNAAFDMQVLRSLLLYYHIPFRAMPFTCSIRVAKKVWKHDVEKFGLSSLSKFLGIELEHHHAESDAMACAEIASKAFREYQVSITEEIESKLHILLGSVTQDRLVQPRNKFLQLAKIFPTRKPRRWKGM